MEKNWSYIWYKFKYLTIIHKNLSLPICYCHRLLSMKYVPCVPLFWMTANLLLVCLLSFHWMLFFAYFSVWFGVSRDARPVEAFFNSNTCIIWNALTELKALTFIPVFYILSLYILLCIFLHVIIYIWPLYIYTLCFVVRMKCVNEKLVCCIKSFISIYVISIV